MFTRTIAKLKIRSCAATHIQCLRRSLQQHKRSHYVYKYTLDMNSENTYFYERAEQLWIVSRSNDCNYDVLLGWLIAKIIMRDVECETPRISCLPDFAAAATDRRQFKSNDILNTNIFQRSNRKCSARCGCDGCIIIYVLLYSTCWEIFKKEWRKHIVQHLTHYLLHT